MTGGHWVWSPRMQELARANKIEAYVLPGGVVMQLYREIGAGRPGLSRMSGSAPSSIRGSTADG